MSDDLRSKIAKSIYRNLVDGITDSTWEIQDNDFKNLWLGVADGVIRELNLDISHTYRTSQGREVCIEGFWTEEVTDD